MPGPKSGCSRLFPTPNPGFSTSPRMRACSPAATGNRTVNRRRRCWRCTVSKRQARRTTCAASRRRRSPPASTWCARPAQLRRHRAPVARVLPLGLTADPLSVLNELRDRDGCDSRSPAIAGRQPHDAAGACQRCFPEVKAFAAVSPVIGSQTAVQPIERRRTGSTRELRRNFRAACAARTNAFRSLQFDGPGCVVDPAFDDRHTAPHHVRRRTTTPSRQRAMRVIDRGASVADSGEADDLVPPHIFDAPAVKNTAHHDCHYSAAALRVCRRANGYDGYLPSAVVNFLASHV